MTASWPEAPLAERGDWQPRFTEAPRYIAPEVQLALERAIPPVSGASAFQPGAFGSAAEGIGLAGDGVFTEGVTIAALFVSEQLQLRRATRNAALARALGMPALTQLDACCGDPGDCGEACS